MPGTSSADTASARTLSTSGTQIPLQYIHPHTLEHILQNRRPSDWSKRYGNPSAIALAGLVMCLSPLACQLMGWRGSDNSGAANNGAHFFCGGLLLFLGGLLDFFVGNTFSSTVYLAYGGFFFALGGSIAPGFGAAPADTVAAHHKFYASYGFFYLFMSLLSFLFLIASLRTNLCLITIFLAYTVTFALLAAADWERALHGSSVLAHRLTVGGGAAAFVVAASAWWVLAGILLEAGGMGRLPVGDLGRVWSRKKGSDVEKQA